MIVGDAIGTLIGESPKHATEEGTGGIGREPWIDVRAEGRDGASRRNARVSGRTHDNPRTERHGEATEGRTRAVLVVVRDEGRDVTIGRDEVVTRGGLDVGSTVVVRPGSIGIELRHVAEVDGGREGGGDGLGKGLTRTSIAPDCDREPVKPDLIMEGGDLGIAGVETSEVRDVWLESVDESVEVCACSSESVEKAGTVCSVARRSGV